MASGKRRCRAQATIAGNAIAVDGFERHVFTQPAKRSDFVKTLTTLRPSDRPRL